jgi:hypothetical protein
MSENSANRGGLSKRENSFSSVNNMIGNAMNTPFVELHAEPGSASCTSPSSEQGGETSLLEDSETITISRFLSPNGNKLYDFRNEPGFAEIANKIISQERTLLDYNRLLTLFLAVKNTQELGLSVAEVGTYKGGSAKFLGATYEHFGKRPPIHVFDTFTGHPEEIVSTLDGKHKHGLFSDTDAYSVREYLSDLENITMHVGAIEERSCDVEKDLFSLVHVDVDIFSATVTCLNFFWPRLVKGGVIVIDDYGFSTCIGVKQAVDYFLSITEGVYQWYMHTGQIVLQKRGENFAPNDRNDLEIEVRNSALNARLMEQQMMVQSLQSQLVEKAVTIESTKNFFQTKHQKLESEFILDKNIRKAEAEKLKSEIQQLKAKNNEGEQRISELQAYVQRINSNPFVKCACAVRKLFSSVGAGSSR